MIKRSMTLSFSAPNGFTLIELLISLGLASFLLLGSLTIAARTLVAYSKQAQITQMNESARFALDYIANRVRESGYWGCMKSLGALQNKSGTTYTTEISGESNASDSNDTTDTLTLLGADSKGTPVKVSTGSTTTTLNVTSASSFKNNDIVLIADCTSGDLAKITNTGSKTVNFSSSTPLSTIYGTSAFVYKFQSRKFSLKSGANGRLALFEESTQFPSPGIELISNVERINILYGEDTVPLDGVPNFYRKQYAVLNMDNVMALRIEIVVSSDSDNMVVTPMSYTFNGHTFTASDKRLYRIYSTTVSRRNKGS